MFIFVSRDAKEYPPHTENLANYLNSSVVLPTFYVIHTEPEILYANYFLSYKHGLVDAGPAILGGSGP